MASEHCGVLAGLRIDEGVVMSSLVCWKIFLFVMGAEGGAQTTGIIHAHKRNTAVVFEQMFDGPFFFH